MPLYDFRCPQCGLQFEVSRPFSRATEPALCPQDSTTAERVFTMPSTLMRGSASEVPPPPAPGFSDHGHGHSHGPGGHTH
jgi:putative FmdB family regulatory protein